MTKDAIVLTGVGDVSPMREDPSSAFKNVAPIFRQADISFCQVELVLSSGRIDPDWALINPENAEKVGQALGGAGFDVISLAGNHHLDSGPEALMDSIATLKKNRIAPVGVGANIAEARAPAIVERKGTRVAFLAYSAILFRGPVPYEATENRPGCAPMYVTTHYEQVDWQPGTPPRIITIADKDDLAAMVDSVKKAKALADVVVISIHWGIHIVPSLIAMYEYEVGHAAIDAGADLILGHHAHILKGIEVYKGKVIFHNLGNFVHDKPRLVKKPDIVGRYGGSPLMLHRFDAKTKGEYPYADSKKTVIAKALIEGGQIRKITFQPCVINDGTPEPLSSSDKRYDEVVDYVKWITKDQGLDTEFRPGQEEIEVLTTSSATAALVAGAAAGA
jgi:poly-gamma-glutamate capsule biosynthesis protein CapA/YwtB (metallophosphatase superfamily)